MLYCSTVRTSSSVARHWLLPSSDGPLAEFRDMNTEVLEGGVSPGELRGACSVMPFLGEARVVIARDLLCRVKGKAAKDLVAVLPDVPRLPC